MYNELYHHGILGQKWGVRRFQNEDGSLTPAGIERARKQDLKWAHKNEKSITSKAQKEVKSEIKEYDRYLSKAVTKYNKSGSVNAYWQVMHNKALAELMNTKVSAIKSPNGQVIKFVAKRGEEGVYMALASPNYDMNKFKNGVKNTGKIGYRDENVNWG